MTLNLYVGNHGKLDGIEDYIRLIRSVLARRGYPLLVSRDLLPGALNFVIDEFTNYRENRRITSFKREHPQSPLVFVLTEFPERKFGVESLNLFGGLQDAASVALLNVWLPTRRDDIGSAALLDYMRAALFAPVVIARSVPGAVKALVGRLFGRRLPGPIERFFRRNERLVYFHYRYLGLKACLPWADAVISSHERIFEHFKNLGGRPPRHLGVIHPEFDEADVASNLMRDKQLFMELTGTVTSYRQSWVDRVNRAILALGMQAVFDLCRSTSFSSGEREQKFRAAYSLHPPQTATWPCCSPMRIYRALEVDHSLPVLTRHFRQHPIEDVCFVFNGTYSIVQLYELYRDRLKLADFIDSRIKAYNKIAIARNDEWVGRLGALLGPGSAHRTVSAGHRGDGQVDPVTQAVADTLGRVTAWAGVEAVKKAGDRWRTMELGDIEPRIPDHLSQYTSGPSIVASQSGFNIIKHGARVMGIRQSLGEVDVTIDPEELRRRYGPMDLVVGDNVDAVRGQIECVSLARRVEELERKFEKLTGGKETQTGQPVLIQKVTKQN